MADIPPILVQLQADVSQLKSGLAQAEASLKGLDDNVKKAGTGFSGFTDKLKSVGAALGATFAATQVVSFFKESINAAMEASSAQTRLREILLNTKGATEAQIAALGAQAEALSKVGVASKENITVTQSQLATFDLQGKTIASLTPAILDYVVAEKGATASTDDYKQMTNGLAQALQGNFAALTRVGFVLDEDTKKKISNGSESERAAAIVEVLNSTYKDFNKTIADTPEGRMIKLKQEFGDLQQEIGEALLPAMETFAKILRTVVIPTIRQLINFVKNNKDEIKAFAIVLGVGATAWGVYTLAVKRAEIAQKALNLVQKANPIGIIITAVALLVAGMVKLFNSNEKFRNAVIGMAKAALRAFASIVPMVAQVAEAILKVVTGPLRAFLEALSKLPKVGKFAKAALDTINKGLDGISDLGDKAAKKANDLAASLDKVAKQGKKAAEETEKAGKKAKDVWAGSKDPKGEMSKEDKKRLDKIQDLRKKEQAIYEQMAEVRAEAAEAVAEAEIARDEKIAEAKERYAERVADLNERYQERVADANEKYGEALAEAEKRRDEKMEEARERRRKQDNETLDAYNKRKLEIEAAYTNRVTELEQAASKKRQDIMTAGQNKLAEIVEKGRERLRSAWESGTAFSLKDLFASAAEKGGSVLDVLKAQLTKTRDFQKQIGALAGKGYTQTFIEQIAKAGPEAGMEMLDQLKKLTPEQEAELQKLYMSIEDLTTSGVDKIAEALSTSTSFATAELADMYYKAQQEIASSLAEVNSDLNSNIAEAKAVYEAAMTEAARTRDEKLAESKAALEAALAEAKKTYDESLADAKKTLDKSLLDAQKDLNKGLADAQKDLNKAIEDAMKAFEKAIDDINARMAKKLEDLKKKLQEIAALLASLGSGGSGVTGAGGGPGVRTTKTVTQSVSKTTCPSGKAYYVQEFVDGKMVSSKFSACVVDSKTPPPATDTTPKTVTTPYIPITEIPRAVPADGSIASFRAGEERSMAALNITQNFTSVDATAWDVHEKTLSAIRYGQAVTPKPEPKVPTSTGGGGKYGMLIE